MNNEKTFEERLVQEIQNSVLSSIKNQDLIMPSYESRRKLPQHYLDDLWASIDWDNVIKTVKPEMEKRICNAIVGNMESEIKTDIKKLMSIEGVREKLRIEIYPKLMSVLNDT